MEESEGRNGGKEGVGGVEVIEVIMLCCDQGTGSIVHKAVSGEERMLYGNASGHRLGIRVGGEYDIWFVVLRSSCSCNIIHCSTDTHYPHASSLIPIIWFPLNVPYASYSFPLLIHASIPPPS